MALRAAQPKRASVIVLVLLVILLTNSALPVAGSPQAATNLSPIKHVIVIMEENHTFDNYFGSYPGANGLANAPSLPVKPFVINTMTVAHDLCHSWACGHRAYDNGTMDGFVNSSNSVLSMGHFNRSLIPYYWDYASQFVLLDNFFSSVMGPSLPNHLYLIAGQAGGLTGDGHAGNLNFTSSSIHGDTFYFRTIMDELDANHVSWKYYAGGLSFNNWNPLPAFASIKNNQTRMYDIASTEQFFTDVASHSLANVVWVMPSSDAGSEHPPYNITAGEQNVVTLLNAVMTSTYWSSTAVFVTWDDFGGWYDHVPPPQVDQFGYGFRVPCLILSPYAKQGFVDHTQGDFTSILKFVETLYSLQPLATRDASANSLTEAFDFSQSPRHGLALPGPFLPNQYPLTFRNGSLSGAGSSTAVGSLPHNLVSSQLDVIAITLLAIPAIALIVLVVFARASRKGPPEGGNG